MNAKSISYHPDHRPLPTPPLMLRLIRQVPWLLKVPFLEQIILKLFIHVRASKIAPGFYAVVPEFLNAENVNLNDTIFINYAPVTIGSNTRFSGENLILTSTHHPDDFSKVTALPIKIGSNVWITYRCIILGGITIGNNVIIGAGSIVTKDIPNNVLAAGNPCRVIRKIH